LISLPNYSKISPRVYLAFRKYFVWTKPQPERMVNWPIGQSLEDLLCNDLS
jgi:hypothetical protein